MCRSSIRILFACIVVSGVLGAQPAAAQYFYAVGADGALQWSEHLGCADGGDQWDGPRTVGSGWQGFQRVFAGDEGVIYAIQPDGTLLWYRHDGRPDGSFTWAGGNAVGSGWQNFTAVFSGGDGVIYALQADGSLLWYRHLDWRSGGNGWAASQVVGVGWNSFTSVFAGDGGSLYGVLPGGDLLWYHHVGRENGSFLWEGPVIVGYGWDQYRRVLGGPAGVIYAQTPANEMIWWRHDGFRDGTVAWSGGWGVGAVADAPTLLAVSEPIEGYAWPLSAAPGQDIVFCVSSPDAYDVVYARYTRAGDQNAAIPLTAPATRPASVQAVTPLPAQNGCGWSESFRLTVPVDWQSGVYAAECTDTGGRTFRITFVVRPGAGDTGDFAVLANTHTWNAYNAWAGSSKYTNPAAPTLSYLRPNPAAAPIDAGGVNHLTRAELWVLDWLATTGYRFDVYTDIDLHFGVPDLAAYKGLILDTHPEYWTLAMRDALDTYIASGGSLLYMAGNGLYELVESSPDGQTLTMFAGGQYPWRDPSYFRNLVPPRPERAVLGVAYCYDNYFTFAPLAVLAAAHPYFAGTGVVDGQPIGAAGLNGGGASGWEMDTSITGTAADGVIVSGYVGNDRGAPPANLVLLARGTNAGGYGADMTCYDTPAGGIVFSAGSLSFGGSLVIDPVLQQVVRNVLQRAAAGPAAVGDEAPSSLAGRLASRPNPFNPSTEVSFALTAPGTVRLEIYDTAGRLVRQLLAADLDGGPHTVRWDGRDTGGRAVASGTYVGRLQAEGQVQNVKMSLVR